MTCSSSWSKKRDKQLYPQLVGAKEHVLCDKIGLHGPQGGPWAVAKHRFAPDCTKIRNTVFDPLRRWSGVGWMRCARAGCARTPRSGGRRPASEAKMSLPIQHMIG